MRNKVRGVAASFLSLRLAYPNYRRTSHCPRANRLRRPNHQIRSHRTLCREMSSNVGEVNMGVSRSTTIFARLGPESPALVRFHPEPRAYVSRALETPRNELPF